MSTADVNFGRARSTQSFTSRGSALPRFKRKEHRVKDTLRNRLIEAKLREEAAKRKFKEKAYRRKLIHKQKRLQAELEYIHFPTILGWYFDGFFHHHIALRKQWADIFNAVEEQFALKKELDYRETFTELARRNFWPPHVYGKLAFRGRGCYLDLKELLRDPAHTPPDTNFEGGRDENDVTDAPELDFMTLDGDLLTAEAAAELAAQKGKYGQYTTLGEVNKHDFYFDSDMAQFYHKSLVEPDAIYYDERYKVWRLLKPALKYNGDWFFHDQDGKFILKDRKERPSIYYFDKVWNVWKKREVNGPSKNGLLPKDYYYDELNSVWLKKKGAKPGTFAFDENGWRAAKRIPLTGPDDWFFNEETYVFEKKAEGQARTYSYDPSFGAWRKNGAINFHPRWSPGDYYWHEQTGTFKRKDAPRATFEFDTNNKFWRKKQLLIGLHNPRNWTWDHKKKLWVPKSSKRSNIFTQILHWRPERDYDKPWLDYIGTNVKAMKEFFEKNKTEEDKAKEVEKGAHYTELYSAANAGEFPESRKTLDEILAEHAEWGDPDFNKSPFNARGPGYSSLPGEDPEAGFLDKTIDRKRLRCGNLNDVIHHQELKAFFYAAISVTKPKNKHPKDTDDYMYIQFPSDQACAAAYRVMQGVDIKGQKIKLSYPRRFQT